LLRLPAVEDNAAMQSEPPEADPPKRQRRWVQFSLRSLMLFTVVCAIGAAWLGRKIERKRQEREAVEAIIKLSGFADYDYEGVQGATPPGPAWLRNLLGENFFCEVNSVVFLFRVPDAGLINLKALPELQILDLSNTQITDAGLEHLEGLTQLQWLSLTETQVTDAGLKYLRGLAKVQELYLSRTQVTDAGLEQLKGLSQLQTLNLSDTQITDAGLQHLLGLTQLQSLEPTFTKVTDAGLKHFKGLTQLQTLELSNTKVTNAGVKDLQRALPNCQIYR
jgi:Leucine-rich repeat (LRR) protein